MWIELENVRAGRRAGEPGVSLLEVASLGIERGDFVAFTGPSGSGKSTLLQVLGGLVRPEAGRYSLGGVRVDGLCDARLARLRGRRIGFVFGRSLLVPELTALENVEVPLAYRRVDRVERRARAAGVLGELGMGARLSRRPGELSPGEQRRVALARALVGAPELLLADDPTRGLVAREADEMMELLESRCALGATVLFATEAPARSLRARRLVPLRDGRLLPQLAVGLGVAGSRRPVRRGFRRRARWR
jgi:ABC-type lipoprotein export system ATPase subunit